MRVKKVYNNSVVLAVDDQGRDAILLGAGLGFALSPGQAVDAERVERTFIPEDRASLDRLATFVEGMPQDEIDLTREIVSAASEQLGTRVTEHLFVPLADHIGFALRRAREGVAETDYPLRWEVQQLYPAEVQFARTAVDLIARRTGIRLPDLEAVPIALHFVNAQLGSTDIATAVRLTEAATEVLAIVRSRLALDLDDLSLPVARFITHLRYLFLRTRDRQADAPADLPFDAEIRAALPAEHACALAVAELLGDRWGATLTDEEVVYLTLHIGRLSAAERTRAPQEADQHEQ